MIDCSQAELSALSHAFPASDVVFCDFHREQAWGRWVSTLSNGVKDKEAVLSAMRKMARATSPEEFEVAHKALMALPDWENQKLMLYVTNHWLPIVEKWVAFYRLKYDVVLTTNNGTEAQNKLLKEYYLTNGRRSLSGLVTVLLKQFFPDRKKHFIEETVKRSSMYRVYRDGVPDYLHDRPPATVKHIMARLDTATDYRKEDITILPEQGTFAVKSYSTPDMQHIVNFNVPSCTCIDFARTKLPCKHFCAIFIHMEEWSFSQLPPDYLTNNTLAMDIFDSEHGMGVTPDVSSTSTSSSQVAQVLLDFPKKPKKGMGSLRQTLRGDFEKGKAMVMYCTNEENLRAAQEHIKIACDLLAQGTPKTSGLCLRGSPSKGCSGQTKRKTSEAQARPAIRSLLSLKRARLSGRNVENWRTRGRVGKRVEDLKKTLYVDPFNAN